MTQFEPEAEKIWQDYVSQVRKYLNASKASDSDEIIADLNDHVERELESISQPVSIAQLETVLERLGSPRQWVPEEDLSWWQQMIFRLRTGPEDWRLAYLSLGVLIFGTLLGPLGLFGSFCLSRAALKVSQKSELQAKRWLIYPSLIIVYCLFLPVLLLWPIAASVGLVDLLESGGPLYRAFYKDLLRDWYGLGAVLIIASAISVGLTVWWVILLLVLRRWPDLHKIMLRPFADSWQTKRLWRIVLISAVVAIVLVGLTATMWISAL